MMAGEYEYFERPLSMSPDFEQFPAERYEQQPAKFYASGEGLDAYSNRADLGATQDAADLVFGAIFEGTAGKASLPQSILDVFGGGLGDLTSFVSDVPIVGDFVEALTGQEDGDYSDLGTFANLLFGRDASLASRMAAVENKIAVGAEYFDNFKRGDNPSSLGSPEPGVIANWVQFGDGEPLGIDDQAAQLARNAFPDDGVRYARCPFVASSSDYSVLATVHPRGTPPIPRTSLYGRCNADMTEGVYVDFFGDRTVIGRFTRSGLNVTRSQWASTTTRKYSNSSTPELRMAGTRYQVMIDSVVALDHVDTSGYPIDATRRTSGFSQQCWTGILAVPQFSAGLASFSVRNNDQTAIQQAQQTASGAASTANTAASTASGAATTAGQAQAAADAVLGVAENADAKAQLALDNVQSALDGAQQAGKEWMVASGGVVLGRNEVNIGPVIVVPAGRDRRITSITYGLEQNTGGLTIQLVKVSPARVSTVIHTRVIGAGVLETQVTGLNIPIENGFRLACNVTAVSGNAAVLLCSVDGALL